MSAHKCKYFNRCSAPLCPLDGGSLGGGIWYPDEEICHLKEFQGLRWVQNQKRLQKMARKGLVSVEGYFTAEMLDNEIIFRKGMRGLDPDRPLDEEREQLERWLEKYVRRVKVRVPEPVCA